ncbi:MAG: hypothetical protein LRY50_11615 [Geovibrio sp.]|nr:hypothetical protein [Geovibrio sp.]
MVSLISATILGFVHSMTKEAIDVAKLKAQNEAIKSILPEFNELGASWKAAPEDGGDSLVFFPAFSSSQELVGVAVKTYSKNGFGGLIQIMVGFKPDGVISGYRVNVSCFVLAACAFTFAFIGCIQKISAHLTG